MEFVAAFGRRKDGGTVTFYHRNEPVTVAADAHLLHMHREAELYYCLSGDCDFIMENGRYKLRPGTLLLTRPGELHGIGINANCRYNRYYIRVPADYFDFLESPAASPLRLLTSGEHAVLLPPAAKAQAEALLADMEQRLGHPDGWEEGRALADLWQLCCLFGDAVAVPKEEEPNLLHPTVRRAADYINRAFAQIESVGEVAREVGVSGAYLSRLFRANMKTTVTEYLRFKRMEHARRLLSDGVPLVEVCGRCGYSDYSYFIAEFRRQTGTTPVRYQKSAGEKRRLSEEPGRKKENI